jgi:hypothetical protein
MGILIVALALIVRPNKAVSDTTIGPNVGVANLTSPQPGLAVNSSAGETPDPSSAPLAGQTLPEQVNGSCGRVVLKQDFSRYTSNFRAYTELEARQDFAAGNVTRLSASRVMLQSGVLYGRGFNHTMVGNGSLLVPHLTGVMCIMTFLPCC